MTYEKNTYYIIGAGGIGQALIERLDEQQQRVMLISRHSDPKLDMSDENNIAVLAQMFLQDKPDHVVVTSGFLHDAENGPEKNLQQLNFAWLEKNMTANLLVHLNVLKALDKVLDRQQAVKVMLFSARVSSISDNRLGGWYSYRMSKAALNMLVKNTAIEWQRKFKQALLFAYHPGTVDTPLSKPFQSRVPKDKLFSPELAAQYALSALASADRQIHGNLIDWQQKVIEP